MAKLSTPSHQCATRYVDSHGHPAGLCQRPAYRRHDGVWLCRPCTRRKRPARPAFEVVATYAVDDIAAFALKLEAQQAPQLPLWSEQ